MSERLIHALLDERDRRIRADDERDRLRHRVKVLDAKLIELSDPATGAGELRAAYRRGYCTGYHTGRAGRELSAAPEVAARGRLGRALNGQVRD